MDPVNGEAVHLRVIWAGEAELRLDEVRFSYQVDSYNSTRMVYLYSQGKSLKLTGSLFDEMTFEKPDYPDIQINSLTQVLQTETTLPTVTLWLSKTVSVEDGYQILEAISALPGYKTGIQSKMISGASISDATRSNPWTGPLTNEELVAELAKIIPGMSKWVEHPDGGCLIGGNMPYTVRDMVIHLNDRHGWTYADITEWLDTLDIDLTVQTPE